MRPGQEMLSRRGERVVIIAPASRRSGGYGRLWQVLLLPDGTAALRWSGELLTAAQDATERQGVLFGELLR